MDREQENLSYVSASDYVAQYAENHNISEAEAYGEGQEARAPLVLAYSLEHNLPMPRAIDYEDMMYDAGLYIYYVNVYNVYEDDIARITYGAYGMILEDAHSSTFSDQDTWEPYARTGSGYYPFEDDVVRVHVESYTRIRIPCSGTRETAYHYAANMGVSGADLIRLGYSEGYDSYWRCDISDSFRENIENSIRRAYHAITKERLEPGSIPVCGHNGRRLPLRLRGAGAGAGGAAAHSGADRPGGL